MTVFFIVAALLVLAAVLFVVPPLLKREPGRPPAADRRSLNISVYQDQMAELERDLANDVITREQYAHSREELERRMLEDVSALEEQASPAPPEGLSRGTVLGAVLAAALIPVIAAGIYMQLGTPGALDPASPQGGMPAVTGPDGTEVHDQIVEMIARLEQRLAAEPQDAEGWSMLGRSYLWLERFDLALPALEKAVALNDRNPQLLVDYADALAMTGGRTLEGRPMELIERALALDPNNEKGLWLAGTAAYERSDYAQALAYWQRLQRLVPPGSDAAQAMANNIAELRSLMSGAAPPVQAAPPAVAQRGDAAGGAAAAAGGGQVQGTISIDGALSGRVQPTDTVFIFARATAGPRMPLAVMRAQARDLPLKYVLDDSMAMDPALSLSQFPEVVVVARVSRSGSAMTQSGDLQGTSAVVRTGDPRPVEIVINEVVP